MNKIYNSNANTSTPQPEIKQFFEMSIKFILLKQ